MQAGRGEYGESVEGHARAGKLLDTTDIVEVKAIVILSNVSAPDVAHSAALTPHEVVAAEVDPEPSVHRHSRLRHYGAFITRAFSARRRCPPS
jgi:hypothetical protein